MARRHHSIRIEGVWEEDEFAYALGTHVMTEDGYPGVIYDRMVGPFGSLETYYIELDDDMGGGEYTLDDIVGPIEDGKVVPGLDVESARTKWYHGTVAQLEVGTVLEPGHGSVYEASDPRRVYLTRNAAEARDWAEFASEMNGGKIAVYEVEPISPPIKVASPETHLDGSPYDEWTTDRARVVARIARRYSDTPLVCDKCGRTAVTSTSGGKDGHTQLCPECRDEQKANREQRRQAAGDIPTAFDEDGHGHDFTPHTWLTNSCVFCGFGRNHRYHHHHLNHHGAREDLPLAERGTVITAEDDYPELNGILWDRPDHVEAKSSDVRQVSLAKAASKTASGRFADSYVDDGQFHAYAVNDYYNQTMPGMFNASLYVSGSRADAQAIADQFPRFAGVKASTLSSRKDGANIEYGTVNIYINFVSSGVNKGVNETGIKRVRGFLAAAQRLGYGIAYDATTASNCYSSLDVFLEALETSKTATTIKDLLNDKRTPWLFRHITGPAADRANDKLPPGYKMDDITQVLGDNNWCRFRRDSNCFFPKELDARATEIAGYEVWVPELRGHCARHRFDDQKACPISEPGPKSGEANWKPDASRSWEQGGQRVSVRKREAAAWFELSSDMQLVLNYLRDADGSRTYADIGPATGVVAVAATCQALQRRQLVEFTFDADARVHRWTITARGMERTSAWSDVRDKGRRISGDGGVRIIANTGTTVTAEVQGDNGLYISSITRVPGTKQRGMWYCACKWTQYVWARSEPYKRFEGRPCSHSMALWFEMQRHEMFGGTITEDPSTGARPPAPQPQTHWSEGLEFESAVDDSSAKMAIDNISDSLRVARSFESSSALSEAISSLDGIRSVGSTSKEFKAKVRGRVTDVKVVDGIPEVEGQPVPADDVIYPTYDPTIGLFFVGSKTAAEVVVKHPVADGTSSVATIPDDAVEQAAQAIEGLSLVINHGTALGVDVIEDLLTDAGVSPVDMHDDMSDFMADVSPDGDGGSSGTFPLRVKANFMREADAEQTGVMVALSPSREVSERLSTLAAEHGMAAETPEQIHLTLAYCGKTKDIDKDKFMGAVRAFAAQHDPMFGKIQGLGTFLHDDGSGVLWASADIAGLAAARTSLCEALLVAGTPATDAHDFTPHLTIAYAEGPITELPDITSLAGTQMTFSTIVAAYGGEWSHFDLVGPSGEIIAVEQFAKVAAALPASDFRASWDVIDRNNANVKDTHEDQCYLCGKGLTGAALENAWMIHLIHGGSSLAALTDPDDEPGSDMGWFPVGSECAKKIPATHRARQKVLWSQAAVDDDAGRRMVEEECAKGDFTHAGVIIKALDSGRILMTQRTPYHKDEDNGAYGKWEFPGGEIDPGETAIEAALREFTEETGLDLPAGWQIEGCQPAGIYLAVIIVVPNEAWTTDAELLTRETMGIGWFEPDPDNSEEPLIRDEVNEADWEMIAEAAKGDSDHCKFCGSDNLFGGEYGKDGLAIGGLDGGVWDVICQDCGKFQIRRNISSNSLRGIAESVPYKPEASTTAILLDEPQPALPEVYGEEDALDAPDTPFVPGDPRLSHLMEGVKEEEDIVDAATAFLQKAALKDFSAAEQQSLIDEGAEDHRGASNDDRLDITGTFYEGAEDDDLVFW